MTTDPSLCLTRRRELAAEVERVRREAQARAVRITARHDLAANIAQAQLAIARAEEQVLEQLPTPLPEDADEVLTHHPHVASRRRQLERLEQVFGPAQLDHAESIAKAILGEGSAETPALSKTGRRVKLSGADS